MNTVLVVPFLKVQNANALSSPFTIGIPSMTSWLGAVHALQRYVNDSVTLKDIKFNGMGIVSHSFVLNTYRESGMFMSCLVGTANPLDRFGKRSSFIEEGRCSFSVSLVIQVQNYNPNLKEEFFRIVESSLLGKMKIAGGDVLGFKKPILMVIDDAESMKCLTKILMPGYVLVERKDLMLQAMEDGRDGIDALLDYLKVYYSCTEGDAVTWESKRKTLGWIVPIATGYQGISGFIVSDKQRDYSVPHRFVESIVTLGEFKMSYKVKTLNEMLWHYRYVSDDDLYLCENELLENSKEKNNDQK
jgi:CRISPR-associated protein Csy2